MKKKGIIGFFGIVGMVLAGLILMPSTPTFAESSSNVTVQLTVLPSGEALSIALPSDGTVFATDQVLVKKDYAEAKTIQWKIIYIDDHDVETTYPMPVENVADTHGNATNGRTETTVNLTTLNGGLYGRYRIIATINNKPSTEDVVNFTYRALKLTDDGVDPNNNDPKVIIDHGPGVDHVVIQIYDEDGNPVLPNPAEVPTPDTTSGHGGTTPWTAPLTENNAKDGKYCIVATPYDQLGNIMDRNAKHCVNYAAKKTPKVPETGGSIFAGTNFTNADFISTSLAIFFVATFFAIMVLKRGRRTRRRQTIK